jgi:hypothetical protein
MCTRGWKTDQPAAEQAGTDRRSDRPQIVGTDPETILAAYRSILAGEHDDCEIPPLWDGQAAQRIANTLNEKLG